MRSPRAVYAQCESIGPIRDCHSRNELFEECEKTSSRPHGLFDLSFPCFFNIVVIYSTVLDNFEKQTWEPIAFVIRVSAGGIVSAVVFSSTKSWFARMWNASEDGFPFPV